MKVLLVLVSGVLVAVALAGPGGAPASSRASEQRLLVKTERFAGQDLVLMNERGKVTASLAVFTGLNGAVTVDRRGTRFAYVQSIDLDLAPQVPPRFRRQLRRLPDSTLELGTFLHSVPLPSGGGFSITSRGVGVTAAKPFRPACEVDLYSVRPDGTGLRRLTYWSGHEVWPAFSPDGRSVAFSSNLTGRFQLYMFELAEISPRRLTSDFGNDRLPAWSPDGRWIAFSSDRDGDDEVFLISPEGERERKLTHNGTQDLVQDWQPLVDAAPPVVRALPSSSPRGGAALLRYTVRDASRRVLVGGDAELRLNTPAGTSEYGRSLEPRVARTGTGALHVLRVPADDLSPFDADPATEPPARFRFCLAAVDPWGNVSGPSCAMFRFR